MNNNVYKDMMDIVEPDAKFKTTIRDKMLSATKAGAFSPHTAMRKPRLRPLLIASVIIIAVATTALAYGDDIWQLIFAQQVENVDSEMQIFLYDSDETITMGVSIINSNIDFFKPKGIIDFSTLDELRHAAAFDVRLPSYLPADIMHLTHSYISGLTYDEDEKIYGVTIGYSFFEDEWIDEPQIEKRIHFDFNQFYMGIEGQLHIETLSPFQRVMIGSSEGIVIHNTDNNPDPDLVWSVLSMYWQKNGVLYIIHSYGEGLDIDTMIKIAESL